MAVVRDTNTPEIGLPSADWETVSFTGDGTAFNRSFRYVHRPHTLKDILRPGYFNPVPTGKGQFCFTLQRWDEISFCVGGPKPCDATRGLLVIEEHRQWPKEDVIVGLVYRDTTTVAGHGGTEAKAEDKEKAA